MAKFKGYARGGTPSAQQASAEAINQIDRETNRIVNSLREQRNSVIGNRDRIANAMLENQRIQNRQEELNRDISLQNQDTILKKQLAVKDSVMDEYNQSQEVNKQLFGAISKFSSVAANKLQEMERDRYIKSWNEDLARVLMNREDDPLVQRARRNESQQEEAVTRLDGENLKAKVEGADDLSTSNVAVQSTELSPGIQKGRMMKAARTWGPYVASSQVVFKNADGSTFMAAEAVNDPQKMQIVINTLLPQFLRDAGLEGVDPGVLYASGMLSSIMADSQTMINNAVKQQISANKSQVLATNLDSLAINKFATAAESRRKLLAVGYTNDEINQKFDEYFIAQAQSQNPSITFNEYVTSQSGPNGEPMGAARKAKLEAEFLQARNGARSAALQDKKLRAQEWTAQAVAAVRERLETAATDEEKLGAVTELINSWREGEFSSLPLPNEIVSLQNEVDTKLKDQETAELSLKVATGEVDLEFVNSIQTPSVKQKALEFHVNQQTSRYGPAYNEVIKSLKTKAEKLVGYTPTTAGRTSDQAVVVKGYLEHDLKERLATLTAPGGPYAGQPQLAVAQAIKDQNAELERSLTDPNGKFHKDEDGNFTNIDRGIARQVQTTAGRIYNMNKAVNLGQDPFKVPELVMPTSELTSLVRTLEQGGGINLPGEIRALAARMGMSSFNAFIKLVDSRGIEHRIPETFGLGMDKLERTDPQTARLLDNIEVAPPAVFNRANATVNGNVSSYTRNRYGGRTSTYASTTVPNYGGLADAVASGEGTYTSIFPSESYPEITNMTIREVMAFQKEKLRDGRKSAAIGRYQFLYPETWLSKTNLTLDDKFTPENQDLMFWSDLIKNPNRRPAVYRYLNGLSNDLNAAVNDLSEEFASVLNTSGVGSYDTDGVNKGSVNAREALIRARQDILDNGITF